MDGREIDEAINEWYETILLLKDFYTGMVVLTVEEYHKLPAAFLDLLRLYRRLKDAERNVQG